MPTLSETDLQRESDRLVQREVNCCLSSLVATLAQGYGTFSHDMRSNAPDFDVLCEQAFELASPVDDYEEAAIQEGWTLDGGVWTHAEHECAEVSAEAACMRSNVEPYQRECYEFWAVSTGLAERLIARGEKVDRDFANLTVWARTTTGQAISMDGVIRAITQEIHNR